MTEITLYSGAPMDQTYTHVFDYVHNGSPNSLLKDLKSVTESNLSYQNINKAIRWNTIGSSYEDLLQYNYLTIKQNSKTYYCFITKFNYLNNGVTEIYFDVDLWTTYYKQIDFNTKCLIERCTIPQIFDSDDVRRMMSLDDPMLPPVSKETVIPLQRLGDPYSKQLVVYILPGGHFNGITAGGNTFNGMTTVVRNVNLNDNVTEDMITSLSNHKFTNRDGSKIIGAQICETGIKYSDKYNVYDSAGRGSEEIVEARDYNHVTTRKPVSLKFDHNENDFMTISNYTDDKIVSDDYMFDNSRFINADPDMFFYYPEQFKISKSWDIGTLHSLYDLLHVDNYKLLSNQVTSLRIDTRYSDFKDYSLSSYFDSEYDKKIRVHMISSIMPDANTFYYVDIGTNNTVPTNFLVDSIDRSIPIPVDVSMSSFLSSYYSNLFQFNNSSNQYNIKESAATVNSENMSNSIKLEALKMLANSANKAAEQAYGGINQIDYVRHELSINRGDLQENQEKISPQPAPDGHPSMVGKHNDNNTHYEGKTGRIIVNDKEVGGKDAGGGLTAKGWFHLLSGALSAGFSAESYINQSKNILSLSETQRNNVYNLADAIAINEQYLSQSVLLLNMAKNTNQGVSSTSLRGAFGDAYQAFLAGVQPTCYLITANRGLRSGIDSYLDRFGNYINKLSYVDTYMTKTSKYKSFTFIHTKDLQFKGSAQTGVLKVISAAFNRGITIYHDKKEFKKLSY